MGYTHYWEFLNKPNSIAYARAIKDINKLARSMKSILSGYSAHAPRDVYGGVFFNGKREDGHEDFSLRALPNQCFDSFGPPKAAENFNFCKTAQKPYDVVVTAALAILKHRLGDDIEVRSDGNAKDWRKGVNLARKVTGLAIRNPLAPSLFTHKEKQRNAKTIHLPF